MIPAAIAALKDIISANPNSVVQRAAFLAYFVRIANAGILFVSQIVLARWMGGFEYGIYVLVWTWVQLLGGIAALGFGTGVLRFLPEYTATGELAKLRGVLLVSRLVSIVAATAIALAGTAIVLLLGDHVESYYVAPFILGFICLPMFALNQVEDGIARSYDWMGLALLPGYLFRPLLVMVFLGVAYVIGAPATVESAMYCVIAATWLSSIGQFLLLHRRCSKIVPAGPRSFEIGKWLRISYPMLLTEGFHVLMINTDVLVLSIFVTPDMVGIYYAAAKALSLISIVFFAAQAAAGHKYTILHASGDREGLLAFMRETTRWTFWASLASAIGILGAGYPVLWLFGSDFTNAYPVMFILAVGILARASIGPTERLLNMIGEQDRCAKIFFASLVANVFLNFALVPFLGIYGAALATSIALIGESFLLNKTATAKLGGSVFVFSPKRHLGIKN